MKKIKFFGKITEHTNYIYTVHGVDGPLYEGTQTAICSKLAIKKNAISQIIKFGIKVGEFRITRAVYDGEGR